jgi:hypothetical protein
VLSLPCSLCVPYPCPARRPRTLLSGPDSDPGVDNRADQIRCGAKQIRSDQMIRYEAPSGAADQIRFRLGYDTLYQGLIRSDL